MKRARIDQLAIADAKVFQDEFPGQAISGDWDAEAWALSKQQLELDETEEDSAWQRYREALHAAVARGGS